MLCAKCHRNEATIHFTMVVNGTEEETVHLCRGCAPPTGFETLDLDQLKALSVIGETCNSGRASLEGAGPADQTPPFSGQVSAFGDHFLTFGDYFSAFGDYFRREGNTFRRLVVTFRREVTTFRRSEVTFRRGLMSRQ